MQSFFKLIFTLNEFCIKLASLQFILASRKKMSSLIVNANYNQVKKIDYNPSKVRVAFKKKRIYDNAAWVKINYMLFA